MMLFVKGKEGERFKLAISMQTFTLIPPTLSNRNRALNLGNKCNVDRLETRIG